MMRNRPWREVDTTSGPPQGPLATITMKIGRPTMNPPSPALTQTSSRCRRQGQMDVHGLLLLPGADFDTELLAFGVRTTKDEQNPNFEIPPWHSSERIAILAHHIW